MPNGKCSLCLQTKEIVSSHLIPAAAYKHLRSENSEPLLISSTKAVQTSRQIQYPLLCLECEGLLNREGENWLLPLLATVKGTFPLHEILANGEPGIEIGKAKLYAAARNPAIDVEKLAHFATGVFWKASVHSWGIANRRESLINLGKYGEPIRQYLRGEAVFPQKTALAIAVLPASASEISFFTPRLSSKGEYHLYTFYLLGIQFMLLAGNCVSREEKEVCFVSNPAHPILVDDFSERLIKNQFIPMLAGAKKSPNLIKYFERLRNR
ncbi:MAG: hypothetical protein KGL59_04570 [Acidobacteriota bacterium]|nr:hypothetical protein [Acidobacteriota bacterium]